MQIEVKTKDYIFDNDPYNEGKFALYNVEGFRCTYRKTDDYEDEYKEKNLLDWRDYINKFLEYGKKLPVVIHHIDSNEKSVYVGYIRNARVKNVMFPVKESKTNKYEIQEDPALIFDIHNIRKEMKDLIMAGHAPNRSLSFAPRKDKRTDLPFDEISHFALLVKEEPPYIKYKDLDANSIEDISTEEKELELANFSEDYTIELKKNKQLKQYKETQLKNYEDFPSMRAIQDIVDDLESDKEKGKDFKWYPGLRVDNEFRKLVVKFMDVLDYPRKRAVAAAYNAIGRYGTYDFSEDDVREIGIVSKDFTVELPEMLPSKAVESIGKVFSEALKNYWEESKHPRAADGKFSSGGAGTATLTPEQKTKIGERVGGLLEKDKAREKAEKEKSKWKKTKEKVNAIADKLAVPLEKKGYSKKVAKGIALTASVLASTPLSITSLAVPIVGLWGATPGLGQVEAGVIYGGAFVGKAVAKSITGGIKKIIGKKKTAKNFQEVIKNFAEKWVTIGEDKGIHLKINDKGTVKTGPKDMEGKSVKEAGKQLYDSKTAKSEKKTEKKSEGKKEKDYDKMTDNELKNKYEKLVAKKQELYSKDPAGAHETKDYKKYKKEINEIIDEQDEREESRWNEVKKAITKGEETIKNLTKKERDSVEDYSDAGYTGINNILRGNVEILKENYTEQEIEFYKKDIKQIDSAIKKVGKYEKPITVLRGVSAKRFDLDKLKAGSEMVLDGFQSTSISEDAAENFSKGGLILRIKTSEGLFLNGAAQWKTEQEILLPRDRKYKIINVRKGVLNIELLPEEKK